MVSLLILIAASPSFCWLVKTITEEWYYHYRNITMAKHPWTAPWDLPWTRPTKELSRRTARERTHTKLLHSELLSLHFSPLPIPYISFCFSKDPMRSELKDSFPAVAAWTFPTKSLRNFCTLENFKMLEKNACILYWLSKWNLLFKHWSTEVLLNAFWN